MNPQDELKSLTDLFPAEQSLILQSEHIPASQTPEPYKGLLVHDHHMTVSMEEYHNCKVDVQVIADRLDDNLYSRKIVLLNSETDCVVQFGIVRFNLDYITPVIREEILSKEIPLGRVLINHNVLRHIDFGAMLQIKVGEELANLFTISVGETTYGRLATIFCNRQPAVDLLEISAPLS